MPTAEDLLCQIDQLLFVWDTGCNAFRKGWGLSYDRPTTDEILDVMDQVVEDILEHRKTYRIHMLNYDCNKLVNYVAWRVLEKYEEKYSTAPLFFGHLHFIDESIRGASLFEIPSLPVIAENLEIFHKHGHMMAPYTFLKGVDLTFSYCVGAVVKLGSNH